MTTPLDNLADLERQRLELEDNIRQLQQSLYHWRLWEAEYDGLKSEIASLGDSSTRDDFLKRGREFGGTLVNEEEIKVLLGDQQNVTRSRDQVVQMISRRIDYVQQNLATMEKHLRAAEDKMIALLSTEPPWNVTFNNEEFPVTEIVEELDEDGRVISSSTSVPGQSAPELLEVLARAGVEDIPDRAPTTTSQENTQVQESGSGQLQKGISGMPDNPLKRGVEETPESSRFPTSSIMEEQDNVKTDLDESPEDAKLRREMLQYGLNEVGAVVAELELDEEGSEFSIEDEYDEDYRTEEDEDEYGRTTRRVLTDEYVQRMRELEEKLNSRTLENIGRDTSFLPEAVRRELAEPCIKTVEEMGQEIKKPLKEKKKKKVLFAPDLDIAQPAATEPKRTIPGPPEAPAMSDLIVEHTEASRDKTAVESKAPKRVSQFRSTQSVETQKSSVLEQREPLSLLLTPSRPNESAVFPQPATANGDVASGLEPDPSKKRILVDSVVERQMAPGRISIPPELDELDEQLHQKEIATEFYQMRNKMIHHEGGFLNDDNDEPAIVPLDEPYTMDNQPKKRISRFMAARVKR